MKRFVLGICLLAVMLGLGLWVMFSMNAVNEPVSQLLESAAFTALNGDLTQGTQLANRARNTWDNCWHGTASAADHAPMDEIDSLFAQVAIYGQTGQAEEFAAHCARLSKLVKAVGEAHSLTWWNLL